MEFPDALMIQLVIITMIYVITTKNKSCDHSNEAFLRLKILPQKPHNNHVARFKKSTDKPILTLLLLVTLAGLKIPLTSLNHSQVSSKIKQSKTL